MARMGVYFEERVARQYPRVSDSHGRAAAGRSICRRSARSLRQLLEDHSGVLGRMTFLETIFARLAARGGCAGPGRSARRTNRSGTGAELLAMIAAGAGFPAARGLKPGDRCALLAPNSIRWVALDLAMMAEGVIVVPLDPRQVATDWLAVIKDSTPSADLLLG